MVKDQPTREVCDFVDERDNRRCVICGRSLYGVQSSRHHRMLRSQAPKRIKHTVQNLMDVCGSGTTDCHGYIHAHPGESYANGWLVHSWLDPLDVPVKTYRGWVLFDAEGGQRNVDEEVGDE